MAVYLGSDKVGVTKELGTDRLQWKCDNMKTLYHEFANYSGTDLSIIKGLDTSKVKDMAHLFYGCGYITSLDLSSFKTDEVTTMNYMFAQCSRLTELDLSHFNTDKLTTMTYMFSQCNRLTKLDISNFNTSNVTAMDNMFNSCSELTELNISHFNTDKVTSMYSMFSTCRKLESLDFSNWDTSKVKSMGYMFQSCDKLKTVKNLNLVSLTSAPSSMFSYCANIMNLTLYNITKTLQIGSGASYGTLLTLDSLVHTIKELWDLTGGTSQKLTLSTASKNLIADVYVKLVDVTDEMIAQDQYAANKKPCVVCESTDEGAMTLTEYATSKNWAIA